MALHPPGAVSTISPPTATRAREQVAATLNAAGRTFAVWDESWGSWGLGGTAALPAGSLLFAWIINSTKIAKAAAAGYKVVAVPYQSYYLDCGLGPPGAFTWWAFLAYGRGKCTHAQVAPYTAYNADPCHGHRGRVLVHACASVSPRAQSVATGLATPTATAAATGLAFCVCRGKHVCFVTRASLQHSARPQTANGDPPAPQVRRIEELDHCVPARPPGRFRG